MQGKISEKDRIDLVQVNSYSNVKVWDFPNKIECVGLKSCLLCGLLLCFGKPVVSL